MMIEIRKVEFFNKGAELMLYAIIERIKKICPEALLVMAPDLKLSPFMNRAQLCLFQKAWYWRYRIQWGNLATILPLKIRQMYGIVLDKEINVVLDASGFSYSEQFSANNTLELARSSKKWKKNNCKVILLPQAFGPFVSSKFKFAIQTVADNVDLMFARDKISYEHLTKVVGNRDNIKIAPDFTNLIKGYFPKNFDVNNNKICIVPNYRMIDKTCKKKREAYLPFMINCVKYLQEKDAKPFLLVHEGRQDFMLAQKISQEVGGNIPIIWETHPLKIKGVLGVCEGNIGSRYHSLVSSLSQGIPSLATGWTHKYQTLFDDYGFSDGVVDVTSEYTVLCSKIDMILQPSSRQKIISNIKLKSDELMSQSLKMWEQVNEVIKSN